MKILLVNFLQSSDYKACVPLVLKHGCHLFACFHRLFFDSIYSDAHREGTKYLVYIWKFEVSINYSSNCSSILFVFIFRQPPLSVAAVALPWRWHSSLALWEESQCFSSGSASWTLRLRLLQATWQQFVLRRTELNTPQLTMGCWLYYQ